MGPNKPNGKKFQTPVSPNNLRKIPPWLNLVFPNGKPIKSFLISGFLESNNFNQALINKK